MISKEDYVTQEQGIVIKYKGLLDFDNLYKESKKWFKDHEYIFNEVQSQEKFSELGNFVKIIFEAKRKIDDMTSFNIYVNIVINDMVKAGKKYKVDMSMYVRAYIDLDFNNKWQASRLKAFLFFIYINFIIRNKIKSVFEAKLFEEVDKYADFVKEHFD